MKYLIYLLQCSIISESEECDIHAKKGDSNHITLNAIEFIVMGVA